jgi:hypothetical protein
MADSAREFAKEVYQKSEIPKKRWSTWEGRKAVCVNDIIRSIEARDLDIWTQAQEQMREKEAIFFDDLGWHGVARRIRALPLDPLPASKEEK